jgi:hypothetical protein
MPRSLTLRHYPAPLVRIACRLCGRNDHYRLVSLIQRFGPEADLPDLLALLLSDCLLRQQGRSDLCGAGYADSVQQH